MRYFAMIAMLVVLTGCSHKAKPPEPPFSGSGVILKTGTGAILVHLPTTISYDRADWMAQIDLEGPYETDGLPRIPLPELQAVLVLNLPPGVYRVTAQAWIRKLLPFVGGSLINAEVVAGEITVLRGKYLRGEPYPYFGLPLTKLPSQRWTLETPGGLREFLATVIPPVTKG
jgi:hypothetical protein